MVRQSLMLAALLVVASPLAGQEEGWVWTDDRPDAVAPLAVTGTQTVPFGELHIRYQWIQRNSQGVWFDRDSLDLATTLQLYEVAPLTLSDRRHSIEAWLGLTNNLTIHARTEFALMERESQRNDGVFYIMSTHSLGDLYADATYNLIRRGAYRMDVNAGAIIPIGPSTTTASSAYTGLGAEEPTPYDMRPGSGSFGVFGSVSMNAQNEFGSVGAQFKATTYVNENSVGFRLGDRYEANGWAAYRFNDYFSVSAGARWEKWGNINRADQFLETVRMRDPMNDGVFLSGIRASMPLGINFVFPEDMVLGGHRLAFETMYVLHHDYDAPQLGLDWGINIGYTARLPLVPF